MPGIDADKMAAGGAMRPPPLIRLLSVGLVTRSKSADAARAPLEAEDWQFAVRPQITCDHRLSRIAVTSPRPPEARSRVRRH